MINSNSIKALKTIKSYREGFVQTNDWVNALETIEQELEQLNAIKEIVENYDINDVYRASDYMQLIIQCIKGVS